MKKIAVLGSSGGNLFNQGGNNPEAMLKEIFQQVESVEMQVSFIQLVCASTSMDVAHNDTKAQLYVLDEQGGLSKSEEGELLQINEKAKEYDEKLESMILKGEIDGLMLLSCDPIHVNNKAILAASKMQIPIAGTGGASMAEVQVTGCRVIAVSGTTGTTNRTRAVSAVSAFAKEWKMKYSPIIGSNMSGKQEGNVFQRIHFKGIMMTSMPGFIAMALCLALSKIPGLSPLEEVFNTLVGILPIIVAAVAAKQVSGMDEVGLVAGIVAGALSVDGGIIGGIIVGIIAGILVYYISNFCFTHKVPGTTTNIAAGGLAGLIAGLLGMFVIARVALLMGNAIKAAIDWGLGYNAVLAGAIAGFAIWFAIIGGVYHAAILPIVLLEMENAGFSFLGAIDLCGLVMVCAGIQLAYILRPKNPGERASAVPNIFVNLVFGTFVEAAYPFMFSSKKVFASAIGAATLSGVFVGLFDVKCTAYVPCFVAPFMSNDKVVQAIICMLIAFISAFLFTMLANVMEHKNKNAK